MTLHCDTKIYIFAYSAQYLKVKQPTYSKVTLTEKTYTRFLNCLSQEQRAIGLAKKKLPIQFYGKRLA